jgi:hypothetical protein
MPIAIPIETTDETYGEKGRPSMDVPFQAPKLGARPSVSTLVMVQSQYSQVYTASGLISQNEEIGI